MESKAYSWAWVTSSRVLSRRNCELIYAHAISDGGEIKDTWLYHGGDATGEPIINLQMGAKGNPKFNPKEPVYCANGRYIGIGSSIEGVFVQWRELG